jgi:hypothetical protein
MARKAGYMFSTHPVFCIVLRIEPMSLCVLSTDFTLSYTPAQNTFFFYLNNFNKRLVESMEMEPLDMGG